MSLYVETAPLEDSKETVPNFVRDDAKSLEKCYAPYQPLGLILVIFAILWQEYYFKDVRT